MYEKDEGNVDIRRYIGSIPVPLKTLRNKETAY